MEEKEKKGKKESSFLLNKNPIMSHCACNVCGQTLPSSKSLASLHIFNCISKYRSEKEKGNVIDVSQDHQCPLCKTKIENFSSKVITFKLFAHPNHKDKDEYIHLCKFATHIKTPGGVNEKINPLIEEWNSKVGDCKLTNQWKCAYNLKKAKCNNTGFMQLYDPLTNQVFPDSKICSVEHGLKLLKTRYSTQKLYSERNGSKPNNNKKTPSNPSKKKKK
jgi:hypothetical protein